MPVLQPDVYSVQVRLALTRDGNADAHEHACTFISGVGAEKVVRLKPDPRGEESVSDGGPQFFLRIQHDRVRDASPDGLVLAPRQTSEVSEKKTCEIVRLKGQQETRVGKPTEDRPGHVNSFEAA
jgi:hypothetical protein